MIRRSSALGIRRRPLARASFAMELIVKLGDLKGEHKQQVAACEARLPHVVGRWHFVLVPRSVGPV